MLKILSSAQHRELDSYTIANEPVASIDLMERACRAFTEWYVERYKITKSIGIVCGTGNNGGDGLGIARLLKEKKYNVIVWTVRGASGESDDFKTNLERLGKLVPVNEIQADVDMKLFSGCHVLIDAVFGSGLSRPAEGVYASVLRAINQTEAIRIAVDIPSGLNADGPSTGEIVKAHYTISFQLPKLAFLFPSSHKYVGEWLTVAIGLSDQYISEAETPHMLVTVSDIKERLRTRSKFDHKGTFGHALLVAGSYGKSGAAVLSARAILRAGAGLLTVHAPRSSYNVIQSSVPEAMMMADPNDECISDAPQEPDAYSSIGVGPGLGQAELAARALRKLLENVTRPMVIDADALNILSANRELLLLIPEGSILTPHPKEFERLVGESANDFERLEKQKALAVQLKCVIVLKGAYSSIVSPSKQVYFNPTGNPGMATGGSGDVLTGIITGLLARSYTPLDAALTGVYLHGLAGDLGAAELGLESLIASDIIEFLPRAFRRIENF